ncbi:MAG: sigma-54-dependent Fis family transcriptional regulator [Gammaproteobacteria bacterium]|nr:sigma-54-dependent Fis family transcriptional regulator [Gammaproteobacteria bacterium]
MAVLVVDDDENILHTLTLLLKSEGMECVACHSPQEALAALKKDNCQLALVDLNYVEDTTSGKEGLALITALRKADEELPIVAMMGWGTIGIAVEAMKRGAADFIEKPWDDNTRLLNVIRTQMKLGAAQQRERKLSAENALLREQGGITIIHQSPAMTELLSTTRRVATSLMPILITGENGTGKGLLAAYIHRHSSRAQGPFISVNMGAISESTFESEMFGHTKGAFTDAKSERTGRVELADQGTLFMDEIANLPLTQQAKILRLVEERQYEKLGSSQTRRADIRFISATNADLDSMIAERGFRQDLLYRLNGITLKIPALRERQADIQPLAENFLGRARQHYESPARRFSAQALAALDSYRWPGNIRELQHVVERSVLLAQQEEILESDFQLGGRATTPAHPGDELAQLTLDQAEIWFVQQALKRHQGNANEAAKALGISRSSLYRRLGKREPP